MKTIKIITAGLFMFSFFNTKAQFGGSTTATSQQGFHFGLKVQPSAAAFKAQNATGTKLTGNPQLGYGFGASLNYFFINQIGLHAEALYSQLAEKHTDASVERTIKLSYINIPILVSFNTNYGKPINLNLAFGPQFGIRTNSELETINTNGNGGSRDNAVLKTKPGDIGLAYGAGIDFGIGAERNFHLNLGYRGVYGLLDINDSNQSGLAGGEYFILQESNISTYGGYVGIMFKL